MEDSTFGTSCLNCRTTVNKDQKFCSSCGQKAKTHRLTIPHFLHEAFHAFTHADKGMFHLLKCLATRPGTTAREYVLGRRKAYFNPFTFFILIMSVFVFLNVYTQPPLKPAQPDERVLSRIPTQAGRDTYIARITRGTQVAQFARANGNILAMIAIPFISLITWLFYRKKHLNYAEHLTANMMFISFSNLLFAVFVLLLRSMAGNTPGVQGLGFLLQVGYLWWSLNGFLDLRQVRSRAKSLAVSFLSILLWIILSIIAMAVFIYRDWDFYKFFNRFAGS